MKKELTCIACPQGCQLEVEYNTKHIIRVTGNECRKGVSYAEAEVFNPVRMITTTIRIRQAESPLIPVKTSCAIPRSMAWPILNELTQVTVNAPITAGDVIVANILGTGADIVATRSLPYK
jgi:CxxC motif-containing protein